MESAEPRPKLIFLVTEDWYFWAHRLPQARAARDAGFRVAVATRVDRHGERIRSEGFELHPLGWRRGSVSLLGAAMAVFEIAQLYRRLRPDLVHHVSQKPILIGSIAARLAGVRRIVNAFTGLGFLFAARGVNARLLRTAILPVLKLASSSRSVRFLVENPDDRTTLERLGIGTGGRTILIRGSGVDLSRYAALPEPPADPVIVGCATRMLRIKGVAQVVEAFARLRARGSTARLLLAGAPDSENPAAIPEAEIRAWAAVPDVEWIGHVEDVRQVWARAHIAVLASQGGEGIPMSLMEAAACGRPLVATDVPGCREIVKDGETGLLAPPGNVEALADAIERLVRDADLRQRLGAAARARIAAGLDAATVGRETLAVYNALLGRPCAG
ncbi:MAG TPA: glycosyltransferase family 4 protein [Alphaproteobacteria bacterium]|nr:glycosyltransferase family 4 protein [Alphaproteobacteria bacterium]